MGTAPLGRIISSLVFRSMMDNLLQFIIIKVRLSKVVHRFFPLHIWNKCSCHRYAVPCVFYCLPVGYVHAFGVRFTHGFYEDCKRDNEFSLPFFHFDFILAIL